MAAAVGIDLGTTNSVIAATEVVGGSTRIPAVQNLVRRLAGGKDPNMTVKARAEGLVTDARQALKEEAPIERVRPITAELQAIYQVLSVSPAVEPPGEEALPSDNDVIDAEFTSNE